MSRGRREHCAVGAMGAGGRDEGEVVRAGAGVEG